MIQTRRYNIQNWRKVEGVTNFNNFCTSARSGSNLHVPSNFYMNCKQLTYWEGQSIGKFASFFLCVLQKVNPSVRDFYQIISASSEKHIWLIIVECWQQGRLYMMKAMGCIGAVIKEGKYASPCMTVTHHSKPANSSTYIQKKANWLPC